MSLDLKRMVRMANAANLIISPRYESFLLSHLDDPVPENIASRIRDLLMAKQRDRTKSFSASSAGQCHRAQIYGYHGVQVSNVVNVALAAIYNNGRWAHLKLQTAMLMAGVFEHPEDIEVPIIWKRMRTRGTMDGWGTVPMDHPHVNWRGKTFGAELKTCHSGVYQKLIEDGMGKYARQVTRYFHLAGVELFAVFAEEKNTNRYNEWVIEADPQLIAEDKDELDTLNHAVANKQLPDRLPQCQHFTGDTFRNCSFGRLGGPCTQLVTWKEVERATK